MRLYAVEVTIPNSDKPQKPYWDLSMRVVTMVECFYAECSRQLLDRLWSPTNARKQWHLNHVELDNEKSNFHVELVICTITPGYNYKHLLHESLLGFHLKVATCFSDMSIHVQEVQGAYVSVQLQWGNIALRINWNTLIPFVLVLSCGLIHFGKICLNRKFAHSAIGRPDLLITIQSIALNMELCLFTTDLLTEIASMFSTGFPMQPDDACSIRSIFPSILAPTMLSFAGDNLDNHAEQWDSALGCLFNAIKELQNYWNLGLSRWDVSMPASICRPLSLQGGRNIGVSDSYYLTAFLDRMHTSNGDNRDQVCTIHVYQLDFFQAHLHHDYYSGFCHDLGGKKKRQLSWDPGGKHMIGLDRLLVLQLPWDPGVSCSLGTSCISRREGCQGPFYTSPWAGTWAVGMGLAYYQERYKYIRQHTEEGIQKDQG